jgi:hypothetical protein
MHRNSSGLKLPFYSGSPPSPTPLARDVSRVGLGILLLYSREEGSAGWQLEGIVQGSVVLSEQNSKVSKTQIKAPGKLKTKTQIPSNLSPSTPAYSLQQMKRLQHQMPALVSDTSLYLLHRSRRILDIRYAQKFKWVWNCHLIAVHPLARPLRQEMLNLRSIFVVDVKVIYHL